MKAIYGFDFNERRPVTISQARVLDLWRQGQDTFAIRYTLLRNDRVTVDEADIANFLAAHRDAQHKAKVAA